MSKYPTAASNPWGVNGMRSQTRPELDFVKDGEIYRMTGAVSVMVTGQADLANLDYAPGTIAYTAGFGKMWQLAASGSWVEL